MLYTFYKYHGTGNDFIIIDNRNTQVNFSKEQIHHLCDRHFGIGSDGLMLMNKKTGYDFEMKYYNADGNESSMCGNGGRCMVRFAFNMGIREDEYSFMAIDGEHKANIDEHGWINLMMNDVHGIERDNGAYILNTGSPHYVKAITDVRDYDVVGEGREIRYSKHYADAGINVNFVSNEERNIYVRTYERGVEDETLSCGTGVTAAALMFAHNDNGFNRIEVQTPGGHLAVEFDKKGEDDFENIWLCGPAVFVFKGEIEM
jgi:diaminopimelate epimerase